MKILNKAIGLMLWGITIHANANTADQLASLEVNKKSALVTTIPQFTPKVTPITTTTPFNQTHALVFFFSSTCHFCQGFAPVINDWAATHHMPLLAYTTNGETLPGLLDAPPIDATLKNAFFGQTPVRVPACFVFNVKTHLAYPVASGALTTPELNERMNALIPKIEAYERGEHA